MIRLTHRERWLTVGLLVFAAAWVLFAFGIKPAVGRIETLNRVIPEKQQELDEIRAKSAQYLALRAKLDDTERKIASEKGGFELLTFLESITKESGFAGKVAMMKQQILQLDSNHCEVSVETKLENLTLKQLVEFLLKIRSSEHFMWIKSFYTTKNATNPNLFDAAIQISTLKPDKTT